MRKKFGFSMFLVMVAFAMTAMVAFAAGNHTNSNGTGQGTGAGIIKAIPNHKTHGNYQNNTNSCASCHQTHTASGEALLFKSSVDATCEACHDATLGIYNVMDSSDQGAGTFGGVSDSQSMHHADNASVTLATAPGARPEITVAATDVDTYTAGNPKKEMWNKELSCASCHDPHGSYSSRLLQAYPTASLESLGVPRTYNDVDGTVTAGFGNQWDVNVKKSFATPYTDLTAALADLNANFPGTQGPDNTADKEVVAAYVQADPTTYPGLTTSDVVIQLFKYTPDQFAGTTKWSWKASPIMSNKNSKLAAFIIAEPTFTATGTVNNTSKQVVKVATGAADAQGKFTYADPVKGAFRVTADVTDQKLYNVALPVIVKIPLIASSNLTSINGVTEQVLDRANFIDGKNGAQMAYAEWCGICHTDYFSSGHEGGVDGDMVHHTVNSTSGGRTCAYCHYSHGTNVEMMSDAVGNTVATLTAEYDGKVAAYVGSYGVISPAPAGANITTAEAKAFATSKLHDVNNSSALKRFTNMTVCYGCHMSSHYGAMGNNGTTGTGSTTGLGNGTAVGTPGNGITVNGIW